MGSNRRLARLRDEQAAAERAEFEAWLDASSRPDIYQEWSPALACARTEAWPASRPQVFREQ
jgi:hypothetical protein